MMPLYFYAPFVWEMLFHLQEDKWSYAVTLLHSSIFFVICIPKSLLALETPTFSISSGE
jgi:hypothetical protein